MKKTDSSNSKNRNRLANESSPYLLQHADNPVDWYPWGKEALNKAKAEDKPIFLSIGYSACHWCHVMAHESFENPDIAALMNVNFINIKVDREERPDLDEIYMSFTTAMTGSGGWPMSVFLTPDLKPFYAGTYFPPDERYGRPGFAKVLAQLSEAYKSQKKELVESSENIFKALAEQVHADVKQAELDQNALSKACEQLYSNFDRESGGFGTQPKFPHPTELSLFLRQYDQSDDSRFLNAAELALKNMARGGIYDQIGGGFHRYATDNKWLVPHFEKMLYDNALLVPVYADAFQITNNDLYLKIIRETLDFLLREMTSPEGGFYSALDADSEGEEGKFYVWDIAEIKNALDEDAERFVQYFNVTSNGNFEGHNILNVTTRSEQNPKEFEAHIEKSKKILLESRSKRIRPHTDDKILTSWNGLAISAFCRGYQVTGERRFLNAATQCASFINDKLYRNGKLTHSYREGVHSGSEFLEDYSFLIRGLLDLYESDIMSGNGKWIEWAQELSDSALKHFQDEKGRFYLRPDGHEDLIFRPKEVRDGAIPSAGSIMLGNLLKLNRITGNNQYLNAAEKGLRGLSANVAEYPAGMASAVGALDYYFRDKIEIVISGKGEKLEEVLNAVYQRYLPNRVIAFDPDNKSSLPLFEGRQANSAEVRAYICRNSVCRLPVTTVEALKNQLNEL
ncbi:MAG TPA: thioredoxin domain-containing protein [candidate division Zixibacteria bacterium]|nr:thioredoxin domain-containing protein [candidate division Zixibacteria bacterium]